MAEVLPVYFNYTLLLLVHESHKQNTGLDIFTSVQQLLCLLLYTTRHIYFNKMNVILATQLIQGRMILAM